MRVRKVRRVRRGAVMLEAAIVMPVLFMLIFGLVIVGMGTFYHQQVTLLAREGARYASVHGATYAKETGGAKATAASVYTGGILPRVIGLDTTKLSYTVTWDHTSEWPVYQPTGATNLYKINYVTVEVTYLWNALAFPGVPAATRTLTSTSRMPLCN
jgi:Flp pilus assembly protein TadG